MYMNLKVENLDEDYTIEINKVIIAFPFIADESRVQIDEDVEYLYVKNVDTYLRPSQTVVDYFMATKQYMPQYINELIFIK